MRTWTLQEFIDKVELEHDLQEESFISPEEMINYVNEGIDWAESIVIGLYEDYYLDRTAWLPIADEVAMPAYIYANKLRKVEVGDSADPDNVVRLFKNNNLRDNFTGYNIYHRQGEAPRLAFENIPSAYTHYRLTFTRNANRVTQGNDAIDLPECAVYYAQQFVKMRCREKERDPMAVTDSQQVMVMQEALESTLSNIVNDGSDQLEADLSFYAEFDHESYH